MGRCRLPVLAATPAQAEIVASLLIGERLELRNDLDIRGTIFFLKARHNGRSHVLGVTDGFTATEGGGDNAPTERCCGDGSNPELTAGLEEVGAFGAFDVALEDRVVDLDGGYRGDFATTAQGVAGYGGKAYVLDFALAGNQRISNYPKLCQSRTTYALSSANARMVSSIGVSGLALWT